MAAHSSARSARKGRMEDGAARRSRKTMASSDHPFRARDRFAGRRPRVGGLEVERARRTIGGVRGQSDPRDRDNVGIGGRAGRVADQPGAPAFERQRLGAVARHARRPGADRPDRVAKTGDPRREKRAPRRFERLEVDAAVLGVDRRTRRRPGATRRAAARQRRPGSIRRRPEPPGSAPSRAPSPGRCECR